MPRYFFDIHDGIDTIDDVGWDLPDPAAAKSEAAGVAARYARNPKMLGTDGGAVVVVVRDGPGSVLMTVRFVFTIEGP